MGVRPFAEQSLAGARQGQEIQGPSAYGSIEIVEASACRRRGKPGLSVFDSMDSLMPTAMRCRFDTILAKDGQRPAMSDP